MSDNFTPAPAPVDPARELMNALTGQPEQTDVFGNPVERPDRIDRSPPQPDEPRRRLVSMWASRVKADKTHHERAFKRMRRNMAFTHGKQWDQDDSAFIGNGLSSNDAPEDRRYVANIALRHVQQRTASLYATNPEVIARKRERLLASVWDGDMATLQAAQQQIAQAQLAAQQTHRPGQPATTGSPSAPALSGMPPGPPAALAVLADYNSVRVYDKMLRRVCKTLELLWDYNVREQTFPFKAMMKLTVRRTIVTGVGYVKLGFQRALRMQPEIETRIADMMERLSTVDMLASDIADGETPRESPEAEQLRLAIQALMQEPQIIAREGLLFDYPDSTAIIPDKKCKSLRGFLGADWVTQEYALTPDEIQQVYGVDVGTSFRAYTEDGQTGVARLSPDGAAGGVSGEYDDAKGRAMVWEIYSRRDGLVYIVCDGYPDFLREPAAPDVYLDRFFPWFAMVLNEGYHERQIFPVSDIDLLRDMQLELNRARQGLREHRRANRPKIAAAAGTLEQADKDKLANHPANALIELNALAPGSKIEDVLQPVKMPPIDPALYDTDGAFEDILRVLGQNQASMGQTTDATATEASVAQSAQHTDLSSCIDDQDDMLSEMAEAAGKILMMNVSAATVQRVIGPGAVWPELTKKDVIENIYLTVRAGSTGRPNKQQEVLNAQILFPMLQRVPGVNPEWMARELIKRMDDRLDLTEAFLEGMPSMDALNRIQGTVATPEPSDPTNPIVASGILNTPAGMSAPPALPTPGGGGGAPVAPPMGGAPNDPTAQGNQGAQNAQAPPPVNGLSGPKTPPVPGANGLMPGKGGGPKTKPQGGLPTP